MKCSASSTVVLHLIFIGISLIANSGCTTIRQATGFKGQVEIANELGRIKGVVDAAGEVRGNLIVILATPLDKSIDSAPPGPNGRPSSSRGVDSYSRSNAGSYKFIVDPGVYRIGAYEDQNKNGLLDTGERFAPTSESDPFIVLPGDEMTVDILLQEDAIYQGPSVDLLGIVERDLRAQRTFSLGAFSQKGLIAKLDDIRFGSEMGDLGLWRPLDFLNEELAGIYFLEKYDPQRIPVLFVHGMSGYPAEFTDLMATLDRNAYQVWFYYYPSGLGLEGISTHLAGLMREMQIRHNYNDIAIIAHSMGGLASRGAILKYFTDTQRHDVKVFISINSPFGGNIRSRNVLNSPIALPPSFADISPESAYMTWLLYENDSRTRFKSLPGNIPHHMIMGFKGSGESCSDGTVSCASQFHPDVQHHSASVRAWNFTHVGTLREERTGRWISQILKNTF